MGGKDFGAIKFGDNGTIGIGNFNAAEKSHGNAKTRSCGYFQVASTTKNGQYLPP